MMRDPAVYHSVVSLFQRSFCAQLYIAGTAGSVPYIDWCTLLRVSFIERYVTLQCSNAVTHCLLTRSTWVQSVHQTADVAYITHYGCCRGFYFNSLWPTAITHIITVQEQ